MQTNGWARPVRGRAELERVLTSVLDRWGLQSSDYRLVGTGAALAQGVEIRTGDIDILVRRRADVDRFAEVLAGFRCFEPPAWLPRARQYYTHFEVDEIDVGASTVEMPTELDTVECFGAGPWQHYVEVPMGRHVVGVSTLELRLVSELVRGRPDRVAALVAHMGIHGADLDLVRRAMTDRQVDPGQQHQVLEQLISRRGPAHLP